MFLPFGFSMGIVLRKFTDIHPGGKPLIFDNVIHWVPLTSKNIKGNCCKCVLIVLQFLNIPVNNFGARRSVLVLILTKLFVSISICNKNLRILPKFKLFSDKYQLQYFMQCDG